ncbi:Putative uncharacterized protein [Taphrina deformans PYCC 5710]|uniref:DDT domain protein n=1 Tax=Taphrina deformans (strain PYCC 5710 / ATCC 11124 / CBS 356.35 / IMI 108563 / JCM 9778 / NBRC 8474) TaxID=1097556 RepID=R4XBS6_TAPDE|nr:Putative uncharacterized protein [Taphrina deformans PYCC 5710]|eukprot:CCG83249.1 Putative uncharacterized protein [Taphrina deformans PYCC 5710]
MLILAQVLYRRKPVHLETVKDAGLWDSPNRLIWQIPETQEIYVNYEDFLQRKAFYDTRTFTCEVTGKTNLTYAEAHRSEIAEAKDLDESFPDSLKEPVLRKAHALTIPRLDGLVDLIYDTFKGDYFPGENVLVQIDGYREGAQIREKTKLEEVLFPDGFHRPASARYVIELDEEVEDGKSRLRTVEESTISRERNVFSKVVLRYFLRNTVRRDAKLGSPWQVKPEYAKKYRIAPLETKEAVKAVRASSPARADEKSAQAQDPGQDASVAIKDLVEDLDLPPRKRKRPKLEHSLPVSQDLVPNLLEVWAFFNVFLEVLTLDSFTLDDFGDALQAPERSELVDELYCSILATLSDDKTGPFPAVRPAETSEQDEQEASEPAAELSPRLQEISQIAPTWKAQLAEQDFEHGHYVTILLGILGEVSKTATNPFPDTILDTILRAHQGGQDLSLTFRTLSADMKLRVLMLLIDLTWQTSTVRQYIDECMDNLTVLRKERADATKVRKTWTDAIHQLRLRMRAQFPRLTVATAGLSREEQLRLGVGVGEDNGSSKPGSSDAESDGEDDSVLGASVFGRRRTSYRLVHKAGTEPDIDVDPTDAKNPFRSRDDFEWEIQKMKKLVVKADARIARIEEEFRESDAQRLRRLGQDRYLNTYWWLESCGMPVHGMPNCSTSHAGYATGRIFVQGPSEAAATELEHRGAPHDARRRTEQPEEEEEERGEGGTRAGGWGYYETEDQVRDLVEYLDPRGTRESKLRAALEVRLKPILHGMAHRARYLRGQAAGERRSSRKHPPSGDDDLARFQRWRNTLARKALGAPHSGEVPAKGVAVTKKKRRR